MPTCVTSDIIPLNRDGSPSVAPLKAVSPSHLPSSSADDVPHNKMDQEQDPLLTPLTVPEVINALPEKCSLEAEKEEEAVPKLPLFFTIFMYVGFFWLVFFGYVREKFRNLFPKKNTRPTTPEGYAPIKSDFMDFWQRRVHRRLRDLCDRPLDSRPSRVIGVMERVSTDFNVTLPTTGKILPCVNMASYNYLGFAEDTPSITHRVLDAIDRYGIASCSAPQQAGQHTPISQLERAFADFLEKDDAIVCGMGFGTNFRGLPALFGSDSLVISDTLNHSSLVNGVRMSGAKVKVFKHGNYDQLEKVLREAVVLGQSSKNGEYVPWTRILIIVEGIYSMEGEIVDLPRVVALKKKYGALLFVDEAHSIGAIGRTGRGVTEHYGVSTKDIDILMGTFTKSFGSIGGYLAGDQSVIDYLRAHSSIALHCDTISPPCAEQVLAVLDVIEGRDGTDLGRKRIHQLKENSRFLRQSLIDKGFVVLGNNASPVVPVLLYHPAKMGIVARECLRRGLALVVVGYPAVPALEGRVRFCVSAAHTREDLQFALDVLEELGTEVIIQYLPRKENVHS